MESTLKRPYSTRTQDDGSVLFDFHSTRKGPNSNDLSALNKLAYYPLALVSFTVFPFGGLIFALNLFDALGLFGVLFGMLCGFAPMFAIMWWMLHKRSESITVKPLDGIAARGHRLTYSQIQGVGFNTETNSRCLDGKSYIVVKAEGQEIRISGYMPPALAERLTDDIRATLTET